MKAVVFLISLVMTFNAYALGGYDTLDSDGKKVVDLLKDKLRVSPNDAYKIYMSYVHDLLVKAKDWHFDSYGNTSLKSGGVEDSKTRFLHLNIVTENRFENLSFVKPADANKVLVQSIETLPRSVSTVTEKYNEEKADKDFEVSSENNSYAIFSHKTSTAKIKTLVYSGVGGVQYTDFYYFELGK